MYLDTEVPPSKSEDVLSWVSEVYHRLVVHGFDETGGRGWWRKRRRKRREGGRRGKRYFVRALMFVVLSIVGVVVLVVWLLGLPSRVFR